MSATPVDEALEISASSQDDENPDIPTLYLQQKVFRWSTTVPDWEWSIISRADEYVALSHTWGALASLLPTTIAGVHVRVSPWKHEHFVPWILKTLPDTWIWMDILCIVQVTERLVQASLQCIPLIYERAKCVHVLLEDRAPIIHLPTYEELDQEYASINDSYAATDYSGRRLPVLKLLSLWLGRNGYSVPDLRWMQRFWTRQEAQYASSICFHGFGLIEDHDHDPNPDAQIRMRPLGPIGQLSSSMASGEWDLTCKIAIELIAARSIPINGLPGKVRQQAGGLVMAFRELRAARRDTKKSRDYVLALFPTFDWYNMPESARMRSTFDLLSDALRQFERSHNQVILRTTMDGIFSSGSQSGPEQKRIFENPPDSFDFFSTFTVIGDCKRQVNGSVRLLATDRAELVEWGVTASQEAWAETLSAVCIEKVLQSQERQYAAEKLEDERGITGDERYAFRDFLLERRASEIAKLRDRRTVVSWISCVHLVLSHRELLRVMEDGAKLMLVKVEGHTRLYPAVTATSWKPEKCLRIFVAPDQNSVSADIAFLGHRGEDNTECHLVGSMGSYIRKASLTQPAVSCLATNALDFWVESSEAS